MGVHVIKMPDIGEGIAEVELGLWHVKVGDRVKEDQAIADVMTDKASVEIPSPVTGVVVALGGKEGDVLAVGSELVRLEVEGDGNHKAEPDGGARARRRAARTRRRHGARACERGCEIRARRARCRPRARRCARRIERHIERRFAHAARRT